MTRTELAPTRDCGFHSLPEEILRRVILEIYAPQVGGSRAWSTAGQIARLAWLATSIPISRPWASQVYPILYNTIDILVHRQAVSLLRSIKRRPVLVGLVRHLSACPSDTEPGEPSTPRPWWQLPLLQAHALTKARRKHWQTYDELLRLCSAVTSCSTTPLDCGFLALYFQPTALCIARIEDFVDLIGFTQVRALGLTGTGSWNPVQFSNYGGFQCLHTLLLQDLTVFGHDIVQLLSDLRPALGELRCYGLQVTDAWGIVPFYDWIMPVHDTLVQFCIDGIYSSPISFHILSNVTFLLIDIAAIYDTQPEDYLPRSVRIVQLAGSRHVVSGRSIYFCAEQAWRIIKASRTVLPDLQTLKIGLTVYNSADLATWKLLSFLLHEAAQRRGIEFEFSALVAYWHDGDSFEWRNPTRLASRGNGRLNRIFTGSLRLARKLARKSHS